MFAKRAPRLVSAATATALAVLGATCSSHPPRGATGAATCPTAYRSPAPDRPRVAVAFDLVDGATVDGHESVRFTPDLPVDRLVFRLVPETPYSYRLGARMRVTKVTVDGRMTPSHRQPSDRSLLVVPLPQRVPAGQPVSIELTFSLRLPSTGADRFGHARQTSWWGSGFPLLAWESGRGWAQEQAVDLLGEVATSEAADTDLTVTAPASLTVLMTGRADEPRPDARGRRVWHAHSTVARDVSVAVGPFTTRRTTAGGATVVVGVAPDVATTAQALLEQTTSSLARLVDVFGPYPFDSLTVAALPGLGRHGVEFPAAVQVGDEQQAAVVTHELAHEWFYALVGNDQARDPWLDEAFATYAQALLVPATRARVSGALSLPEPVGRSMTFWAGRSAAYSDTVYGKGADALLTARQRAGAERFDRAIRCYVNANAWAIATPAALQRALVGLPKATAVLKRAGAIP